MTPRRIENAVPATVFALVLLVPLLLLATGCPSEPRPEGGAADAADAGAPEPWRPRHVFLVTVDTLRADHLGFHGYPRATSDALDALAAGGLVFERAIAQWPKTGASFASAFTGQYPQTTGLTHEAALTIPEEYLTLPELFQTEGYTTLGVVSNGVLSAELGWDTGFDAFAETWRGEEGVSADPVVWRRGVNAVRVNETALPMLEEHKDAPHLFAWIHYSDPHAPYVLPEGWDNPFLGDEHYTDTSEVVLDNPRAKALGDHRELRYYVAAYDANVRVTDVMIGELLEALEGLGLLEDALVVFTADHGESLGEHDYYFGHGRLPYNTTAHVPLVFAAPGAPGRIAQGRVERPVELVDLYPTFVDLLAAERDEPEPLEVPGLEGESLMPFLVPGGEPPPPEENFRYAFAEAGGGKPLTHFRFVQDAGWKLVYHPPLGENGSVRPESWELYDLAADPGETVDVQAEHPREARRLARELSGWMRGSDWIRRPRSFVKERSAETEKALRALGYL